MDNLTDDNLKSILKHIITLPSETEWFELKQNNFDPLVIGKNISAIMNSLVLTDTARGYIIWGVSNDTREIVGTSFIPETKKYKNEELLFWLSKIIVPHPNLSFRTLTYENGKRVVVLVIDVNPTAIAKFDGVAWIRIGSNTTELKNYPIIEKEIWQKILSYDFETAVAEANLSREQIEERLDFEAMYIMRQRGTIVERGMLFDEAVACGMVTSNKDSTYNITNLGALLYARNLGAFRDLSNKTVRIIVYKGNSKIETIEEYRTTAGYVVEFDKIYRMILSRIIDHEEIGEDGVRRTIYRFPYISVRELLANTLGHQDFTIDGLHPTVEIFDNRIEFSNLGSLLVPDKRLVDFPPRTRNEGIMKEFFNVRISESRGTGWDKIAAVSPKFGCPTPQMEILEDSVRVSLMGRRKLNDMTSDEKMWTIYTYACYLWVSKEYLTNQELRKLFRLPDKDNSVISRLLTQAVEQKYLRIFDVNSSPRDRKYLPVYVER
ncbi:putative DNA binding domain-containing protein [Candidatus Saccharibacteria bacterium]|nr:putative DNA binding domain-containing protein [Candidatus Saccharibacteria bacterium]MBQ3470097.1 putative DNA binding domain-containing protein [Candidatus Saccharibacteria bacterium]